jgi:hypothetical protein
MIVNDNSDGDAAHFIGDADAPGGGTQEQRSTKTASLKPIGEHRAGVEQLLAGCFFKYMAELAAQPIIKCGLFGINAPFLSGNGASGPDVGDVKAMALRDC